MLMINITFLIDLNIMHLNIDVRLFRLRIIKIDVDLLLNRFKINNGKYKKLKLILKQEEKYLISQIKQNILNKLYYDSISANLMINTLSPAITAITVGVINQSFEILKFYLLSKNADMDINLDCSANFSKFVNKVKFDIRVYFTIFDMVYAIILSFYKRREYVKEKRR